MYLTTTLLALAALPLMATAAPPSTNYLRHLSQILVKPAKFLDAAQFDFAPYQVTNITLDCQRPNTKANYSCALDCKLYSSALSTVHWTNSSQVSLHDPNSVRENNVTSCSCHHGWSWDGVNGSLGSNNWENPVAGYQTCLYDNATATFFRSSVPSFNHPGNFSLEVSHTYHDDENFTVPWDYPTTFAMGEVILDYHEEKKHHKNKICLNEKGPVDAPVIGVTD